VVNSGWPTLSSVRRDQSPHRRYFQRRTSPAYQRRESRFFGARDSHNRITPDLFSFRNKTAGSQSVQRLLVLCSLFVRHSDFFADEPCTGELVPVEQAEHLADLPKGQRMLWCSVCGTEFRYRLGSEWVKVIYRGFVNTQ